MNYQRIYDDLIVYRKANEPKGYVEKHHIQMRSLGGSDDESNLVKLTGREHYVAHLLLHKILRCSESAYALWMMQCKSSSNDLRPAIKSSRMYEWARKEFAKYISRNNRIASRGSGNSQFGTRWICNVDLKENRKIAKDALVPEGWKMGRNLWKKRQYRSEEEFSNLTSFKKSMNSRGSNNSQFGKQWFNDGIRSMLISRDAMIPKNMKRGRLKKIS